MRRIPPKVARKANARVHNVSKWAFWFVLSWIALAAWGVYALVHIQMNSQATLIGKSVNCVERPAWDYMAFCSPLHDGPACTHESRSRMINWYEGIDYACAKTEPPKQFRFPVNRETETLEIAEVG